MIHWEGVLAVSIMISPIFLLGAVVWYSDYTASKQHKKSIEKYFKNKRGN